VGVDCGAVEADEEDALEGVVAPEIVSQGGDGDVCGELPWKLYGWLHGKVPLPVDIPEKPFEVLAEGPAGNRE